MLSKFKRQLASVLVGHAWPFFSVSFFLFVVVKPDFDIM
jgi:hypothetical protein